MTINPAGAQAPTFTSANATTFTAGTAGTFTITTVPADAADLVAMLTVARAAGHHSGAALRRVELPTTTAQSFGKNFHDVAVSDAEGADVLRLFFARESAKIEAAA